MKRIEGRLQLSGRGFGFLIPSDPDEPDIYIPRANMNDAMHGDQVVVRLTERAELYGRKPEGWVAKIIERANTRIVGTYDNRRGVSVMQPADAKIAAEILIPKKFSAGARAGDQVIVEITRKKSRFARRRKNHRNSRPCRRTGCGCADSHSRPSVAP